MFLARYQRSLLFFFQAEDGIRDGHVTGVQTCALPISPFPATREELIEWAERNGLPQQAIDNLYELDEIEEGEETIYEGIEDIWPDYIRKEDFFHGEEDEGFDYDDV